MKSIRLIQSLCFSSNSIFKYESLLSTNKQISLNIIRSSHYKSTNLWASVLSVSNQGAKKGRGKRRGAGKMKNLNVGQELGAGKYKVEWPGLNVPLIKNRQYSAIKELGTDKDRESRLLELRNKMDKFRRLSIPAFERGWSGARLEGKSIGPPESKSEIDFSGFDTKVLEYKVVATVTSILGKKRNSSVFVVTGNGKGLIGLGQGKAANAGAAMRLANINASLRLINVPLFEDRTLFHNFYQEFYYTKIYASRKPPGYGLKCHRIIKTICEMIGLKDLHAKVEGSDNPRNIAKAFMTGLINQKQYDQIAAQKKLHVVEFKPEMNNYPVVLASPENNTVRHSDELENEFEKDLDLLLLNNRYRRPPPPKKPFYAEFPSYKKYLDRVKNNNKQRISRLDRLYFLDDDAISSIKHPRPPKPKQVESENTEAEATQ